MKVIFISHPLMSEGTVEENRRKAEEAAKRILAEGNIPFSPLNLFSMMESETPEQREEIMKICRRAISYICDELESHGTKGGCEIERRWAEMERKPVKDMTGRE